MPSPQAAYDDLVASGKINADPAQAHAMELLSELGDELAAYNAQMGKQGWAARLGIGGGKKQQAPKGLYLWGGVGRGKSMIMDLFFDHVPVFFPVSMSRANLGLMASRAWRGLVARLVWLRIFNTRARQHSARTSLHCTARRAHLAGRPWRPVAWSSTERDEPAPRPRRGTTAGSR